MADTELDLVLVAIRPIQEIAAEPATLQRFLAELRVLQEQQSEAAAMIPDGRIGGDGWSLIADPDVPAAQVHFRPARRWPVGPDGEAPRAAGEQR